MSIHIQIIFCYDANLVKTPIPCFNKNNKCRLINDLIFGIVTASIPLIFIFIFGWMTVLNIRSSQNRIKFNTIVIIKSRPLSVTEQQQQQRAEKRDRSLLKMLLLQVILLFVILQVLHNINNELFQVSASKRN